MDDAYLKSPEFLVAIDYVLDKEKGIEENPYDPGGITKFGISLRFLKAIETPKKYNIFDETINKDTILQLTLDQAKSIYFNEFWLLANFEHLTDDHTRIYLFDTVVNHGLSNAVKCLQRALWSVYNDRAICKADGILGEKTIELANNPKFTYEILSALKCERAGDYRVEEVKSNNDEFIDGWLTRAYQIKGFY